MRLTKSVLWILLGLGMVFAQKVSLVEMASAAW
jgi:hypothetical protein